MTRPQRTACGDVAKGSAATVPGLVILMLPQTPAGIFVTHNMAFLSHSAWHFFVPHTVAFLSWCEALLSHKGWHFYVTQDGSFVRHSMTGFFLTQEGIFCHTQHGIFISHRVAFLSRTTWHFYFTQDGIFITHHMA